MPQKTKPAGGNRRAEKLDNSFNKQHSGIERVRAICIRQILVHNQRLDLATLRARVRDWCTRSELNNAIAGLELASEIHIEPSLHGPLIVCRRGPQ